MEPGWLGVAVPVEARLDEMQICGMGHSRAMGRGGRQGARPGLGAGTCWVPWRLLRLHFEAARRPLGI